MGVWDAVCFSNKLCLFFFGRCSWKASTWEGEGGEIGFSFQFFWAIFRQNLSRERFAQKMKKNRHTIFVFLFGESCVTREQSKGGRATDLGGHQSLLHPLKQMSNPFSLPTKKVTKKPKTQKSGNFPRNCFPPQNEWGEREREWGTVTMGDWGRGMGFSEIKNVFLRHSFINSGNQAWNIRGNPRIYSSFCQICLLIFETRAASIRKFPFLTGFQSHWIGVFLHSKSPRAECVFQTRIQVSQTFLREENFYSHFWRA